MGCIRSSDGFARPVQFTYKGEDEFTTTLGGVSSIITLVMIILYGG